jgi:hypothetical protein
VERKVTLARFFDGSVHFIRHETIGKGKEHLVALAALAPRTPLLPRSSAGVASAPDPDLLPYRLTSTLVVVAALASAVGVFHPAIFHDPAGTAGNARGTDLVILIVAIPALVAAMILAARGSLRAQIVWLGALNYITYNAIFFAYGVHFNPLFLIYAAMLSLAVWSIVALLLRVNVEELRACFTPSTPVRIVAGYLLLTTALFALVWLKDIIPAIAGNTTPQGLAGTGMVTNPVQMNDFTFSFPLTILAALWLWQRRAWGYLLGGAFLVYGVIEALSIATDQVFGHISDPHQSLAAVPAFVVLTLIGLVPAVMYFRHLLQAPERLRHGVRSGMAGEQGRTAPR